MEVHDGLLTSDRDSGFTLIELLVVILIIGVLAAIAIPVFLSQRAKGYDAAAKSDLRNLANFEEMYLSDHLSYGTGPEVLAAEPKLTRSANVTDLRVVTYTGVDGYCLSATTTAGRTWYYDSQNGGLQPAGSSSCSSRYTTAGGAGIS